MDQLFLLTIAISLALLVGKWGSTRRIGFGVCFLVHSLCYAEAKGTSTIQVNDVLVHNLMTKAVSQTGGIISQRDTANNGDKIIQIRLPDDFDYYRVVRALNPLMKEIGEYYISIMPWKLQEGVLSNFNIAKDGSNRALSILYFSDKNILGLFDSPSNSTNIELLASSIEELQNIVICDAVSSLNGFIIGDDYDDTNPEKGRTIGIRLQNDTTQETLVSDLKPITTYLETKFFWCEPWEMHKDGNLTSFFFCDLKTEQKEMGICFRYVPASQFLLVYFIFPAPSE